MNTYISTKTGPLALMKAIYSLLAVAKQTRALFEEKKTTVQAMHYIVSFHTALFKSHKLSLQMMHFMPR